MTARLVVKQGPVPNQQIELQGQLMNIGRSADNEIVINDAEVSRRHARILHRQDATGSQFLLEDLGSTNGSFVNNLRCNTITPLSDGDVIEFGDSIQVVFLVRDDVGGVDENDFDTADLPPLPATPPPQPAPIPQAAPQEPAQPTAAPWWTSRRILIGCGCATLLLICLCGVTLIALDSFQGGRLLYCGGLRPFFETILGPFGFSPVCP